MAIDLQELANTLNGHLEYEKHLERRIKRLLLAIYAAQKQLGFEPVPLAELTQEEKLQFLASYHNGEIQFAYSTDGKERDIRLHFDNGKQVRF